MIRCPNLRDDKGREAFNAVLARLGGEAMSADDITPRQPYLAKLNEAQTTAYHQAHYLWNAHKTPAEIGQFLDALDQVQAALSAEPAPTPAKTPAPEKKAENETGRTPSVHGGQNVQPSEPEAAPLSNLPAINLARDLLERLRSGKPITAKIMQAMASEIYGTKLSEGQFDRKDMADALELAVNMRIAEDPSLRTEGGDWRAPMAKLDELLAKLPTQRVRSEEQQSFQQFSTPPTYSAAAAYVANLRDGDTMLEPSAGTGSLVAASMRPGVKIIANELSERRAALLRALVGDRGEIFHENAEQLNNTLPDTVKPSVVVMNPPFSQTAGRMGAKKVPMTGAIHVEQGLKRLEPGGRLVAIVGRGMTMGAPVYRAWWTRIGKEYAVRANIGVDGKVYEKYGTTFGTRLLVIDKIAPTGEAPVLADVASVDDLMQTLEPIRNGRTAAEQPGTQSSGAALAEGSASAGAEPLPASSEPGALRPPGGSSGGVDEQSGTSGASGGPVRVEGGERTPLASVESGSPAAAGNANQPAPASGHGTRPESGGRPRPQLDMGSATERKPGSTTQIELAHAEPGEQGSAEISDSLYDAYRPQRVKVAGAKSHPTKLVESAAMASVLPPLPTYKPHLPQSIIDKGLLSDAQLEAVISAGEAHSKMLPAAEGDNARRRGYFIGDGTGVGKGREISGIILDNWNQGRRKAVWVSKNGELYKDATRDWSGLEQDPKLIFEMNKVQSGEAIKAKHGIAFVGYDTLKMGMSDQEAIAKGNFARRQPVKVNGQGGTVTKIEAGARGQPAQITVKLDNGTTVTAPSTQVERVGDYSVKTRVDQLVEWVGKDFDGVIAFDEAHNMANAGGVRGKRGMKEAAAKALAGIDLQRRLPNARVVYVSATGATEVANLAYADRLGVWGRGTPFASREAFTSEVEGGGIAAMELIARDLKQLGSYIARNLSYDGVEYDRVEHKLDANQREIYDTLAGSWQIVLKNINAALATTGAAKNAQAKTAAMSAFWGGHQRFFNQIVTSLQMPSVIKAVEKDLAEGRQVVFQMVSTNEASQERAAAKAKTAEDIEDLDITPRDQIIQLIEKSFPTQQYEEYVDDDGKVRSRPVMDSAGNPVQNKEAVKARDALIQQLASIRVPQGALDMILDHFGADNVAEVTGRKRRFILKPDEKTGQMRRVEDRRPGNAAAGEISSFQAGKKKLLAFSQKGDTGESYHADRKSNSAAARRSHYLIQGGWQADRAVQGLGRSHRSNQASAPIFHLVTTDLPGQKRFISSIARRLGQLGALTKGQRQAGDQGIFSARDNLESPEARTALRQFFTDVARGTVDGVGLRDFENQTGLKLTDPQGNLNADLPDITTFLNRLLSLKIDLQNAVFEAFEERHEAVIEARREAGVLDAGLETVKADKIAKIDEHVVHTVEGSGAQTKYVKLKLSNKFKPTDFTKVAQGQWRKIVKWVKSPNGKVYGAAEAPNLTDASTGAIVDNYRLISPVSDTRLISQQNIERRDSKWSEVTEREARALWQDEINAAPEYISHDLHLITGVILPIWDRLKGNPRVVRLQTDDKERLIGRVLPNDAVAATLKNLGAESKAANVAPLELFQKLAAGGRATLANGWTLSRRMVAGEHRIELKGPNTFSEGNEVKADGVFTETIDYKRRYFVPMQGAQAETVLRKLTQYRPVTELTDAGSAPDDMVAGEGMFSVKDRAPEADSDALALAVARRIEPPLRAVLDHMGLGDIKLKLPATLSARFGGQRYELNGHYFRQAITIALNAEGIVKTLHHEALHALRDMGLFKDTEWQILAKRAERTWRKQYGIDKSYAHLNEDRKNEEGVAHAYADWATGKIKVDGRIARLFKRIRDFFEALRNALHGLGFKTAEDVFRDVKEGEIGRRPRTAREGEGGEPAMAIKAPDTEAFKQWFGDSKVVDESGEPKVMYHGTREGFEAFDRDKANPTAMVGPGFYFTDDPSVASGLRSKDYPATDREDDIDSVRSRAAFNMAGYAWQAPNYTVEHDLTPAKISHLRRLIYSKQNMADIREMDADGHMRRSMKKVLAAIDAKDQDAIRSWLANEAPRWMRDRMKFERTETTRPQTYPVYLAIKNPYEFDAGANAERYDAMVKENGGDKAKVQELLKERGYDGIHYRGGRMIRTFGEHDVWVAFDPSQVKSATGNRGTFDPGDERIMFSVREGAEAEPYQSPKLNDRIRDGIARALDSKAGRKFVEGVQDLSHPVKLLQRDLEMRREGTFEDPEDFYTRKRLYPGRVANQTVQFNKKHLDPIVNLLKSNEIGLQEAGDYLYALHAAERNAEMDKINPSVGGEGSGMSNEEAEQILTEAKRGEHAAAYDELRSKVEGVRNLILDIMEKAGLEKLAVLQNWKEKYKDYVPLRGWEVEPDDAPPEFRGAGAGFNVRGKEVKQAFGRRSKADNPLVNILDQAYRTFDRAERNHYLQSLYRAIDDLGDDASDIATLDRGKPRREIDPRTGMVRSVETSNQYMNPKAVYLKFDGNPHFMVFRDQELAEQVKRMGAGNLGILQPILVLQNKMKALWTHYSPDFLFRHFMFRYPIEGALNSFEQKESGEHKVSQYVREAFPFIGKASKAIFASNKGELHDDPEIRQMQSYWNEMRRAGGAMMFRNMRDIDLTREHLMTALEDLSDKPLANARAKWRHGIEAMDTVTNALDNALRLAAYASARRQGKTIQQAAFIAREATIDFQLKGLWANLMGVLFPFANPAVQTSARMIKAVGRSKIMRRVFMGTMLAGFLTSAFNYLAFGDDKDGIPFFDKIPEWDRRMNFIVLTPAKDAKDRPEPLKIPMPYNWAFPLMLGYAFGGFMFGKEGPRKLMAMVLHSALETFTPLGSEGNVAAEFTPSTLRPLTYNYTNLDWAGRPVHPDATFQKRPNSYSSFKSTGQGWKDIAEGVNTATGGNPGRSGSLDFYPEEYRELMDQFVGTQLRTAQNVWDTTASVAKGEWPDPKNIPLGRVVYGNDYDAANRARYYEYRDQQKHPWRH